MIRRIVKAILNNQFLTLLSELFIVVIGIFIAFQVDRWWAGRTDDFQKRQYISRLSQDFKRDTASIQYAINLANIRLGLSDLLLSVSNDLSKIEDQHEAFLVAVNQAAFTHTPSLNSDSFEELRSTGKLELLENDSLKSALFEYYRFDEDQRQYLQLQLLTEFKHFELASGILTNQQQKWVQDSIYILGPGLEDRLDKLSYPDEFEVLEAAKRLQSDMDLIAWLPQLREMQLEIIWVNNERKKLAESILSILEEELRG